MHALAHYAPYCRIAFFLPVQKGGDGWTVKNQCRQNTSSSFHRRLFPFPLLGMILTQSTEYVVVLPPEIRAAKRETEETHPASMHV